MPGEGPPPTYTTPSSQPSTRPAGTRSVPGGGQGRPTPHLPCPAPVRGHLHHNANMAGHLKPFSRSRCQPHCRSARTVLQHQAAGLQQNGQVLGQPGRLPPDHTSAHCSGIWVHDLGPLAACTGLTGLHCGDTPVEDLTPLATCTGLQLLFCYGTRVADLTAGTPGLQTCAPWQHAQDCRPSTAPAPG